MSEQEKLHIEAQIRRLQADAERHRAIAVELDAHADLMAFNLKE